MVRRSDPTERFSVCLVFYLGVNFLKTDRDFCDRWRSYVQEKQESSAGGLRVRGGRHDLALSSLLQGNESDGEEAVPTMRCGSFP